MAQQVKLQSVVLVTHMGTSWVFPAPFPIKLPANSLGKQKVAHIFWAPAFTWVTQMCLQTSATVIWE